MIVPLVTENEWLPGLSELPPFLPPPMHLVVVAPHPDDETLGIGGFIAAQRELSLEVTVVAVTDGENAYPGALGLAGLRTREQTAALQILGVPTAKIKRLKFPDGHVASREPELTAELASLVGPNTHLLAPWTGDFHPDHESCGRAAEQAAHRTGARLTYYLFWTWHFATPALLNSLPLQSFSLNDHLLHLKAEALQCHQSQLGRSFGEPILPASLLAPARRSFETFLIA